MAKKDTVKKPVVAPEEKVNPTDAMAIEDANKRRAPGNWIPATKEELAQHEADGTLVGHDPETGHVLLKEE